jgi:hypothetical protein
VTPVVTEVVDVEERGSRLNQIPEESFPLVAIDGPVQDGHVKLATAVRHLDEMADVSTEHLRLRQSPIGWPLQELWVTGELLDGPDSLRWGSVVLVLDLPPDDLTWLARHPTAEWIGSQLRLGKRPFAWAYRPSAWPVWNHRNRRLARFWSADHGTHTDVLDLLQERELERLPIVEAPAETLLEQLTGELAASRHHLRRVLDQYWDPAWRRGHKGYDESPEDHLWRAAQAVSEMEQALTELGRNERGKRG